MRRAARWLAAVAAAGALLAGCASVGPRPDETGEPIAGRLAVRVAADGAEPARSVNAGFELGGDAGAGRLDLSTPIGTLLARALWGPGGVVLRTPQGETAYPDLATLTRDLVGEELPVAALFDWLRGRPWPAAPSVATGAGFAQLGWDVGLGRWAEGLVVATRARPPEVRVQVRLDNPPGAAAAAGIGARR